MDIIKTAPNEINHRELMNSGGIYKTRQIFYEYDLSDDKSNTIYTLKDYDYLGFPSIKKLYVSFRDPTELAFANTYFMNYTHWVKVCAQEWFKPIHKEMQEELEMTLRSEALQRIKKIAESGEKVAPSVFNADRILVTAGWKEAEKYREKPEKIKAEKITENGRPTREKILREAQSLFDSSVEHDLDFERILGSSALSTEQGSKPN